MANNKIWKKGLVVGIIILFIGTSITSSTGKIDRSICQTSNFKGSLLGYVNDTSGNPIVGALVRVYFHGTYEEDYSDSSGYYITDIPICYCYKNATCSKEGYQAEWVLIGIAENTTHDFILTSINNNPPLSPVMWTEDFSTFYILTSQNPDGDDVYFWIDWGDGTSSEWIGPYAPGETACVSHEWIDEGTYEIKVKVKNQDGESRWVVYSLTLSSDFKFFRVKIGYMDMTYTFTIYWTDGCDCWIMIDWGDGEPTEWFGPYEQPLLFYHEWSDPGVYELRMKMKDIYGNESDWFAIIVTILSPENSAPSKPYMSGKWIIFRVELEYNLRATDPDGDDVKYYINWGDGNYDTTNFYKSNETVTVLHSYSAQGCYTVRAFAEDIYGLKGPENTLPVRSKNKAVNFNLLFLQLLGQLPILSRLLQRLRL